MSIFSAIYIECIYYVGMCVTTDTRNDISTIVPTYIANRYLNT